MYTKLRSTYVEALPTLIGLGRPAPHDVPPGRRRDRPAVLVGPEPPEHPDPDGARPADPPRVRRRGAGRDARRRRLLADRAADPRPRVGRRAPPRRLRPRGRHPPRDGRARAPQGPGGRHVGRALDGQDGQLRARLRDERLRAVDAGPGIPPPGGAGVHQLLLRGYSRHQLLHAPHQGTARDQGFVATLLGRKRQIPELQARNAALRAAGERMAINMPIQGTAADIVKIAMIRLDRAAAPRAASGRGCSSRSTTNCCSRSPRDEVDRLVAGPARDDGGGAAARRAADRRHQGRRHGSR